MAYEELDKVENTGGFNVKLDELTEVVGMLHRLLSRPEPELHTWQEFLKQEINKLKNILAEEDALTTEESKD